ncbi:hypothetical protein ACHQM5_012191 [Ranunculus cassubicifolius]
MGCAGSKNGDSKANRVARWKSTGTVGMRDSELKLPESTRPGKLKRMPPPDVPTTSLIVPSNNTSMQNCRGLKHANILLCLDVYSIVDQDSLKFIYEDFASTLADVPKEKSVPERRVMFWKFTKRRRVIGMTSYLRNIVIGLVDAILYLSKRNVSHNKIGSFDNIVFSRDGIPMIHNFTHSSHGDGLGVSSDFNGIADMLDRILKACKMRKSDLNCELRSLLSLFRTFPEATVDPPKIKEHPALKTAEERKNFVYAMRDALKRKNECKNFNRYIWDNSKPQPSLTNWIPVASSKRCLKKGAGMPQYHCASPASLVKFTRNTYQHINDNLKVPEYTDERLEKIFLKLFPNLYIEWWYYREKIDVGLLQYQC